MSEENEQTTAITVNWPRFLVIESLDTSKPIASLSPFVIEKAMKGIVGEPKSIKKLRSGVILVELSRSGQSLNLLKQTQFASVPVRVTEHRTLNSSRGVVRCYELAQMDSTELVEQLSAQGVVAARNITQRKNGTIRKTVAIVLTFASAIMPKEIKAGYLKVKVDQFIPNPLRCFGCQAFGHHQTNCTKNKVCPKCSQVAHGDDPCTSAVKCPNCGGDHPAYATSCPKWAQEKEICRMKTTRNITFPEARKLVNNSTQSSTSNITYASAVKSSFKSVGTQTDVTHCKCTSNYTEQQTSYTHQSSGCQTEVQLTVTSQQQQEDATNKTANVETDESEMQRSPRGSSRGRSSDQQRKDGKNPERPPERKASLSPKYLGDGAEKMRGRTWSGKPKHKLNLTQQDGLHK